MKMTISLQYPTHIIGGKLGNKLAEIWRNCVCLICHILCIWGPCDVVNWVGVYSNVEFWKCYGFGWWLFMLFYAFYWGDWGDGLGKTLSSHLWGLRFKLRAQCGKVGGCLPRSFSFLWRGLTDKYILVFPPPLKTARHDLTYTMCWGHN